MSERGFCAIGIEHSKTPVNVGTLWRSAANMGAAFIFTVGGRYPHQRSDTLKAWRHVPLFDFESVGDLTEHLPFDCRLVGVELVPTAKPLPAFKHPERACYLLGAEDRGLSDDALAVCDHLTEIPSTRCLNVAVAGSIVLYDRTAKASRSVSGFGAVTENEEER